jgi:hypothetical protein
MRLAQPQAEAADIDAGKPGRPVLARDGGHRLTQRARGHELAGPQGLAGEIGPEVPYPCHTVVLVKPILRPMGVSRCGLRRSRIRMATS